MRPFVFERAETPADVFAASRQAQGAREVQLLAGGTTLIDLMKLDVMRPKVVIDINALERTALGRIEAHANRLRLGALVRMADAADHPVVRRDYPVIAQSLLLAASAQLRNMGSLGGNTLQRTRCTYFRDVSYTACNKRNPGSGCAAMDGFNRMHAVLGTSDQCIATYAGDFAQALIALDANIEVIGPAGSRSLPFSALHRVPGDTPDIETTLRPGEIISPFFIAAAPWTRRSLFVKVRDRESYEFAVASAAVVLDLADGLVRSSRIALGGMATMRQKGNPSASRALIQSERSPHEGAGRGSSVMSRRARPTEGPPSSASMWRASAAACRRVMPPVASFRWMRSPVRSCGRDPPSSRGGDDRRSGVSRRW
jgi:xanthine dehydrogenase YagS FAD-binding subunit